VVPYPTRVSYIRKPSNSCTLHQNMQYRLCHHLFKCQQTHTKTGWIREQLATCSSIQHRLSHRYLRLFAVLVTRGILPPPWLFFLYDYYLTLLKNISVPAFARRPWDLWAPYSSMAYSSYTHIIITLTLLKNMPVPAFARRPRDSWAPQSSTAYSYSYYYYPHPALNQAGTCICSPSSGLVGSSLVHGLFLSGRVYSSCASAATPHALFSVDCGTTRVYCRFAPPPWGTTRGSVGLRMGRRGAAHQITTLRITSQAY
jgi:hypothetical protein